VSGLAGPPSLAGQPFLEAGPTRRLMAALEAARPGGARFVGGCVRNALLGLPVADVDIAVQLRPEAVAEAARAAGCAVHETGLEHGTLTIVCEGSPFEVTTLRRDVSTDGRRAVVAFTEDWTEDAGRRDFTINALYADAGGCVFDPTGRGLSDLGERRVVFVGDPDRRIAEDYLRILRFFRFYAWYGEGDPDGAACAACARGAEGLSRVSAERIGAEVLKLLAARDPVPSLEAMRACGVYSRIFEEGVGPGSLSGLSCLRDPLLRLILLCREEIGRVRELARRLRLSNADRNRMLAALGVPAFRRVPGAAELRALVYRAGLQPVEDRLELDTGILGAGEVCRLRGAARDWTLPALPVSGEDLIAAGHKPGPDLGRRLALAREAFIASDFSLEREALLQVALGPGPFQAGRG